MLKANGADIKTVQELLRHATVKMTLEVYVQAVTPAKRQAQSKEAGMLEEKVGAKWGALLMDLRGPLSVHPETRKLLI